MVKLKDIADYKDVSITCEKKGDVFIYNYFIEENKIGFSSFEINNEVDFLEFYPLQEIEDPQSIGIGKLAFQKTLRNIIMTLPETSQYKFRISTDITDSFFGFIGRFGLGPEELNGKYTLGYIVDNFLEYDNS